MLANRRLCFNRTFMELKAILSADIPASWNGFNRTFMELKEGQTDRARAVDVVSIAPLWN